MLRSETTCYTSHIERYPFIHGEKNNGALGRTEGKDEGAGIQRRFYRHSLSIVYLLTRRASIWNARS